MVFEGNDHYPIGDVTLEVVDDPEELTDDILRISDIGSSGSDGVCVVPGSGSVDYMEALGRAFPDDPDVGAFIETTTFGEVDDKKDQPQGTVCAEVIQVSASEKAIEVTPTNLGDISASSYRLVLMDDTEAVYDESGRTGAAVRYDMTALDVDTSIGCGDPPPPRPPDCDAIIIWLIRCEFATSVEVVGGSTYTADTVFIAPESAQGTEVGPITSVEYFMADWSKVEVDEETSE